MIMWIVLGYLAASVIASLLFYATCIVAARADRVLQNKETSSQLLQTDLDAKRKQRLQTQNLALHA